MTSRSTHHARVQWGLRRLPQRHAADDLLQPDPHHRHVLRVDQYRRRTGRGLAISGLWPRRARHRVAKAAPARRAEPVRAHPVVIGVASSVAFNSPKSGADQGLRTDRAARHRLPGVAAFPRPLMFFFGRRFGTDGTPAHQALERFWSSRAFAARQYFLTVVRGVHAAAEVPVRTVLVSCCAVGDGRHLAAASIVDHRAGRLTMWYAKRRPADGSGPRHIHRLMRGLNDLQPDRASCTCSDLE